MGLARPTETDGEVCMCNSILPLAVHTLRTIIHHPRFPLPPLPPPSSYPVAVWLRTALRDAIQANRAFETLCCEPRWTLVQRRAFRDEVCSLTVPNFDRQGMLRLNALTHLPYLSFLMTPHGDT